MLALLHFIVFRRPLVTLTTAVVLSHAVLIAIAWGYIASWINEVIKQDHFSKQLNTFIADAVVVATALVVAILHVPAGASLTWGQFASTLWYAGLAAAGNYLVFLKPSGIADRLQTLTTFRSPPKTPPAPSPAVPVPPAAA